VQIDSIDSTPGLGYPFAKELLRRNKPFTALLAYNDISAIGAIWAFNEAGLRVPEDVSVIGFDDIPSAAYNSPSLTTVRQPLQRMGQIAAQTVIDQIEGNAEYVEQIAIEPEFVVRDSTARVPAAASYGPGIGRSAIAGNHRGEVAQRTEP
jgi:LacI family transcriptional regulator